MSTASAVATLSDLEQADLEKTMDRFQATLPLLLVSRFFYSSMSLKDRQGSNRSGSTNRVRTRHALSLQGAKHGFMDYHTSTAPRLSVSGRNTGYFEMF
jgi:hypothetical protein